tara:strand:+ start:1830 stop:3716 length:1887 start_codon:yes stop_codon:yes gene_type:complete
MAINYLTTVDLNKNSLDNARIQNLGADPSAANSSVGQIYFNTGIDTLKQYVANDGSGNPGWIEVGATSGVETLTLNDGTYINVNSSGTAAKPVFAPDLNAVDGTAVAATRFLSKDNTWDVPAFPTPPTVNNGTLTMTTSTGLDGGTQTFSANQAGNTTFAVSLDLNELPAGGTLIATDSIIALNGAVESKQLISAIPLSIFNNDLPTASDATITLAAGDILDGGGAFTLNQSASETITFDLATGGIGAGTYGTTSDSNKIDNFTVDAYGRITAFATGPTGQVNTVTSSNTSTLTATGTINKTLTAVTAAVVDGGASLATGDQIYDFVTGQIANIPSGLAFEGNWNASTDTPDLSGASPDNGQFWIVSVAGNTNLDGITDWKVGDWAIYVSTGAGTDGWQKVDNTSTLSGSGVANQLTYWTGTANVAGDAGLTYDATGNNLTVGGTVTSSGGNSGEWNNSYDNMITALNVAGTTTKTLTATQQDGGTLTASWTDNDSGGTVTNIATSGPITGGPITSTGTIGITTASAGIIGAGAVAAGTGISVAYASGIATVTNTQTNSANTYAGTITDSVSGTTFNHGLGEDVIVQLYDTTNKDTVYADVVRNGNYLNISFSSTPTNSIRVLVQKIG